MDFPLVAHSRGMLSLIDKVVEAASSTKSAFHLIPIVPGNNRLEVPPLFERVLKEFGRTTKIYTDLPSIGQLDADNAGAILFMDGDRLTEAIQKRLLQRRSVTYVLAAVSVPLHSQHLWGEDFKLNALKTLWWPEWKERREDHYELVSFMHSRMRTSGGGLAPSLDKSAMDYLLTEPFSGSDRAYSELKRALTVYIARESTGPLTSEHFTGAQKRQALTDRRDIRPTPSPIPPPTG